MNWIKSIFKAGANEVSSKRVCGVTGWMVILGIYIYGIVSGNAVPEMGELLMACVALLGVDSVTSVFKNSNSNESKRDINTETEGV